MTLLKIVAHCVAGGLFLTPATGFSQEITFSYQQCQQIATDCFSTYQQQGYASAVECYDSHTTGSGIKCEDKTDPDDSHDGWLKDPKEL